MGTRERVATFRLPRTGSWGTMVLKAFLGAKAFIRSLQRINLVKGSLC